MEDIGKVRGDQKPRYDPRQQTWTVAIGVFLAALALLAPIPLLSQVLLAVSAVLICAGIVRMLWRQWLLHRKGRRLQAMAGFIQQDSAPSVIANADGQIKLANPAAARQFDTKTHATLAGLLQGAFANPGPVLFRLQARAQASGNAQEDVFTATGHLRICVHSPHRGVFVWRMETVVEREAARSANSVFALPMIIAGGSGAVLHMNDAARALIGTRITALEHGFPTLPIVSGAITSVTTAEGEKKVIATQVPAGAGRSAFYLIPAPKGALHHDHGWQRFEDLPVPLIKLSASGEVEAFNALAKSMIGVVLVEGVHLSQLMEGLGRSISDWIKDALADRSVQSSEFLRLKREDREVFVQVVLSGIAGKGESGLIAVLQDATELKTLEAQFVQSQKMQAIGQLAGGVAHDFNNLLTAITGHCDLLLLRHKPGDPDYGDLIQINQNANRAASLVGQLLAFSRKQTLRLETVDIADTLADLTHLLNRLVGAQITLTFSHEDGLKPVRADKRQLEQVLMNLVVNARDAMPAGGEIRISTQLVTLDRPVERDRATLPAGSYVTVRVCDDGTGIPADKLHKVFEPFFTTKRTGEGTGLGLSTAYGIIKQSNGFIFVDSVLGKGTSFTIYLPAHEPRQAKSTRPKTAQIAKPSGPEDGVILLVEDEAPVRAFASRALRLRGYTVLEADCAEGALRTLEDQTLNIDLFVTDVVMPGMDGPSWVREALKKRPDVGVVFVSGYAEESFGEEQIKIPNSVFLPKPFSLSDLTEMVHQQIQ